MVNIAAGLVDMIHHVDVIMSIAAAVRRRFWMAGTMARWCRLVTPGPWPAQSQAR